MEGPQIRTVEAVNLPPQFTEIVYPGNQESHIRYLIDVFDLMLHGAFYWLDKSACYVLMATESVAFIISFEDQNAFIDLIVYMWPLLHGFYAEKNLTITDIPENIRCLFTNETILIDRPTPKDIIDYAG